MPKCKVVKAGWLWRGVAQELGVVIEESAEWIANRVNDGGLVVPIEEPVVEIATARVEAERAVSPRGKKSK